MYRRKCEYTRVERWIQGLRNGVLPNGPLSGILVDRWSCYINWVCTLLWLKICKIWLSITGSGRIFVFFHICHAHWRAPVSAQGMGPYVHQKKHSYSHRNRSRTVSKFPLLINLWSLVQTRLLQIGSTPRRTVANTLGGHGGRAQSAESESVIERKSFLREAECPLRRTSKCDPSTPDSFIVLTSEDNHSCAR